MLTNRLLMAEGLGLVAWVKALLVVAEELLVVQCSSEWTLAWMQLEMLALKCLEMVEVLELLGLVG